MRVREGPRLEEEDAKRLVISILKIVSEEKLASTQWMDLMIYSMGALWANLETNRDGEYVTRDIIEACNDFFKTAQNYSLACIKAKEKSINLGETNE